MPEQHIQDLLNQFFKGTISAEQQEQLSLWIEEQKDNAEFGVMMEQAWHEFETEQALTDVHAENLLQSIMNKVRKDPSQLYSSGSKPVSKRASIATSRWLQYAAVVILLFGATLYVWLNQSTEKQIARQSTVKPSSIKRDGYGKNKALLTLADGSIIELDSAADGALAQQGATRIIKLKAGQLAYEGRGNEAGISNLSYNTLSTPRGVQYQISLPDGSNVWLNAASSLRFPAAFQSNERRVELTGEAYFEVARDARRPFFVKTGEMVVQVLGTSFNINGYKNESSINTTLITGSLRVVIGNDSALLKPGQQSIVSADTLPGESISINRTVDMDDVIAWKNGWFYFEDTELAMVMRQVERWYDVDVVIKDDLSTARIMARIARDLPLEKLLHKLELTGKIRAKKEGNKIIISR
jgi:ferric-dicitrate binding protein FerR (iron transport regulator)